MPTPAYSQYINKYETPNGTEYWLRDEEARELISQISGDSLRWVGITTTAITDQSHTPTTISIGGENHTVASGDVTAYRATASEPYTEFVYAGDPSTTGLWQKFGDYDPTALGDLAYKDDASGSFTPSGSVSAPTISVSSAGATDSAIDGMETAAPGATAPSNPITYCDVTNHVLRMYQVGYTTDTFKTGDASYTASQPTFTGTADTVTVS